MRIPCLVLICAFVSAFSSPGFSGEKVVATNNRRLNLPLIVSDHSGVNRPGEVVTGGIPMPRGLLMKTDRLRIVDSEGRAVPCQFSVTDKWWSDKKPSVRWLLVSLVADVLATESSTYYLRNDGGKRPATALKISQTDEKVTVVTGPLKFTVSKKAFNLFDEAWYDQDGDGKFSEQEQYIKSSPENGGVVTSGDWPEQGYKAGEKYYSSTGFPRIFTIEEKGDCRVLIRVDGTHYARDGGSPDGLYDFRCRIEAFAGSPGVKVSYSISNMRVVETWKTPPIKNFEVGTKIDIKGSHAVQFLRNNDHIGNPPAYRPGSSRNFAFPARAGIWGRLCSDSRVTLYQDSSGGNYWKDLPRNNVNKRIFGGDTVPGVTFRGYRVFKDKQNILSGNQCAGQADIRKSGFRQEGPLKDAVKPPLNPEVSYENRGLILTFKDFWQHYPKGLYGQKGRIAAQIFPEESGRTFHVNRSSCRTHQMQFFFHGRKLYKVHYDWLWGQFHNPMMPRAAAAWYARSKAYDMGLARVACIPLSEFDKNKLDGVRVGSEAYGWISPWNPGGKHWNQGAQFVPWVARGDWRAFQEAEVSTWWARDLVQIQNQCSSEKIPRFYLYLLGWNRLDECKIKDLTYPGYKNTTKWIGKPDSGHTGMLMFLEHYRLSGDRFSRDAVERIGLRGRAYNWKYSYKTAWTKKFLKDPDKEPFARGMLNSDRYSAWPLFNFVQGISLSGDRQQMAEAAKCVKTYRNAMRYSPIGFLCLTINDKGSPEVYGRQYKLEQRGPGASAVYANFQFGLVVIALGKYYEETGDQEALDTILAVCDVLAQRSMIRDKEGAPLGWSYCWGDVWGPNSKTKLMWDGPSLTALGYGYRYSGRADFLEILKAAYRDTKDYYSPFTQVAYAPVVHPRKDQTPPAAISDLKLAAAGAGVARLSWSAPGGNGKKGRTARYQIKYAPVRMVDRVTDWPPPGKQMPADKAGYRQLAMEHIKKIGSFHQALNVNGEPLPAPAGQAETFEIKELTPGKYWFAIKSFDAAGNISPISNIVEVEIK
jgi:PcRGLX-like protein central beta sandwich domain